MSKTLDWDVLGLPGVMDVAETAARKMGETYGLTFEYDDAYQEALILLSTKADMVRDLVESGELGLLHFRLHQDLTDLVRTEAGHRSNLVSRERLLEQREKAA